uniref:Uncharacterized protein n=1 Tax=Arundo donax TaxID=35708 RepID=A0A0A9PR33_ARUDO
MMSTTILLKSMKVLMMIQYVTLGALLYLFKSFQSVFHCFIFFLSIS